MVYILYGHAKHLDKDKYWETIGYETNLEDAEYDKKKLEEANGEESEFEIRSYDLTIDTSKLDLPYHCCSLFMAIKYDNGVRNPVKGFLSNQECEDFISEDYDRSDCIDSICVFNRPLWEKNNWKKSIWYDNF